MGTAAMWKYLGVLTTLLLAGLGAPIPEELPIVTAGALVGHDSKIPPEIDGAPNPDYEQRLRWWIMLPMCILGVIIGDGFLYTIGRVLGFRVLNIRWVRTRLLTPEKRERIERNFHRYGIWILLGARLLPGIRSPIFLMAGINRLPLRKFLLADGLYAVPGVSMLFFLAYYFQSQFVSLIKTVDDYKPTIVLCVLSGILGYTIRYFQEHPFSTGDPGDVPVIGSTLASTLAQEDDASQQPAPASPSHNGPPDASRKPAPPTA